ncbi:hypothetical protein QFC20_007513 [Naganishia adeliensis]|uniref:Uncharacterized protein n=1 Tax=Naganishia adeliensis TaxID=92952 RepID=A0ACC2UYT3_9TREE|nr:hypothetical protein QFC20_007513 [Naganishia adeliensis]
MEKDEYEQHTVGENVVDYVQEQPLTDDEQKLHLKSFLVLIAIAMLKFCQIYNVLGVSAYFVVGACLCGFVGGLVISRATSMNMAIAGAAVTGISYGAQPLAFAIPSAIMPRKYRVVANLGANVAGGIGAVLSLLIGSTLMRNNHEEKFRILFYISAGVYFFSAVICQLFYNPPRLDSQVGTVGERLACMDWTGYALFTISLTLFCMGLTWGKNPYSWSSGHVLAPLLIGVGLAILLAIHQWKFRRDGLFDRHIFSKSRNPGIVLVAVAIEGAAFFAISNYYPIVAAVAFEPDLRRVTTMLSIGFFTVFLASPLIGFYSKIFKDLKWLTLVAFIFFAAFFGSMMSVGLDSRTGIWVYPVFFGLGLAAGLTGLMAAAQFGAPADSITRLSTELPAQIAARTLPLGFNPQYLGQLIGGLNAHSTPAIMAIPGITPAIIGAGVEGLKAAFIAATKYIWVFGLAISVLAAIMCAFIENLSNEYTQQIDHPVEIKSKPTVSTEEYA